MAQEGNFLSDLDFSNLFGGGGKSEGSGMDLSQIGNLFGGGGKSEGSGMDLSQIGNLFGGDDSGGEKSDGNGLDMSKITDIIGQGKTIVDQLRSNPDNGGSGNNDPIVGKVKELAAEEAASTRTFTDWSKDIGTLTGTGATVGSAIFPGLGTVLGGIVGAVGAAGKNLIQMFGGRSDFQQSADMEKTLYKELEKAGVKMPSFIKPKHWMVGYSHGQKEKAQDIGELIALVKKYKTPAAAFVRKKLLTTDRTGSDQNPIQKGETQQWVQEYVDLRARLELQIERMQKAIESMAHQPYNSIKRAEQAYQVVQQLHRKYPHRRYKETADKLLQKIKDAQQRFKMATAKSEKKQNQRKYLYIGGAVAVGITLLIIILSVTD